MKKARYILDPHAFTRIYGETEQADLARRVSLAGPPITPEDARRDPAVLSDLEILLTGWGAPTLDAAFLDAAPKLEAVFYGAGSVRGMVTDAFWERNIRLTSAYGANAVPVSEFTLAQILLCLKRCWYFAHHYRHTGAYPAEKPVPGAYNRTVGIISLGMIGRRICEMLRAFDLKVLAFDPFAAEEDFKALGVEPCGLDDLFRRADVVSLHTPWLPETEGMITGAHLARMKPGASFINTARGAVVREKEMIAVLRERPDLTAVLDVTHPEPPAAGSPLFSLPNVMLTPHIAGALGRECNRLGRYMVEELDRYLAGETMRYEITRQKARRLA